MSNPWRLPAPGFHGPYNPDGLFNNPAATNPLPAPVNPPIGVWIGAREPVSWAGSVATWGTPVFDLRPDLRGLVERSQITGFAQGATPLWVAGGAGAGGHLFTQIDWTGSPLSALDGLEVWAQEFGAIADTGTLIPVTPPTNVTSAFTAFTPSVTYGPNPDGTILTFTPKGEGVPVRYWQLRLTFVYDTNKGPVSKWPFIVQGAYY